MGSLAPAPWEIQAEKCRKILKDSLNPAWLLSPKELPPASQLNVSTFIETCKLLTPRELEITATSATELVHQMASGSLTAVETATAFLKRAHVAHQLTNLATEFMVDEALSAAAELDAYFKATGKLKGPLHGLPISAKEHIGFKGRIAHSAYVSWIDNIAEEDALMIQLCNLAGDGQESVRCVISPLANSVEDLNLFQSAVLDQEPWEVETSLVPLPWKRIEPFTPEQITVGIIWDDGLVRPHPPVTRALKHAVARLRQAGVKVVDFEPYNHSEGLDIVTALYFPDAARTQKDILAQGGEPIAPLTQFAFSVSRQEALSIAENWALNARRDAYREEYHRIMKERGVDFILCPAYVGAAAALGTGQYWLYTAIWNILDQPCMAFPTGLKADPAIDVVEGGYQPRSAVDETEHRKYVPESFADVPIALQLVGKHFRDEEAVGCDGTVVQDHPGLRRMGSVIFSFIARIFIF
ncbi:glutamyl-tRNA(gln) amidotransferase subunit A [Fusarium albosuccineum]|uniref:Glutamyl-tRNA(Gln) amidotransferase subunit A n=1 Tax=Fusarium albosuccineum TaxID=1237068 RepID=A0A8H4PBK0_9HYPO|nr:glutamyl-tRNA(gln) amidotransferase subunit A [Fusarium albosuccineum]